MNIPFNVVPTLLQKRFLTCPATEILFGGAAGGGKSFICVIKAFLLCMIFPGIHVGLFRETLPELEGTLILHCLNLFPKHIYKYRENKRIMKFSNGSYITFNYLAADKDMAQYRGVEFSVIIIDEAVNMAPKYIKFLKTRLRTTIPGFRCRLYLLTNPIGVAHSYLYDRYIKGKLLNKLYVTPETKDEPKERQEFLCYIPSLLTDNHYLMDNDPNYMHRFDELSEDERNAFLKADWTVQIGKFFLEWSDQHIIDSYLPRSVDSLYLSGDFGTSAPSAFGWYSVQPSGHVKLYRELYTAKMLSEPEFGNNMQADDLAIQIVKMTPDDEKINFMILDSACWANTGHGKSIYEIMQPHLSKKGIAIIKSDKDRKQGLQQIRRHLKIDPMYQIPWLQVTKDCPYFLKTFPEMIHHPKIQGDIDGRLPDHHVDQLYYFLMKRPQPKRMVQQVKVIPGTFDSYS